jgi:Tfp pilus assembly protein PilV
VRAKREGLGLIEVLVSITLLTVVGLAVVAGFSSLTRLNQDARADVEFVRVARTVMERMAVVWGNPERWQLEVTDSDAVQALTAELDSRCTAEILAPLDAARLGSAVRVLQVSCQRADGMTLVFQREYGAP